MNENSESNMINQTEETQLENNTFNPITKITLERENSKYPIMQRQQQLKTENQSTMITIPKAETEQFIEGLQESLQEIDSFKEYVSNILTSKIKELENFENNTVKLFNSLVETASNLKERIDVAGNYENYLEERIKNANLEKDVATLELSLQKEKQEITLILGNIQDIVKTNLFNYGKKVDELKSADDIVEESIKNYEKKSEQKLDDVSNHLVAMAENQFNTVKIQCDGFIKDYTEKCQKLLETIKNQSINFLKQCENENKKLIEKVPEVKNSKYSKKDILIFTLSGLTILTFIMNFFMK